MFREIVDFDLAGFAENELLAPSTRPSILSYKSKTGHNSSCIKLAVGTTLISRLSERFLSFNW
eukprot:1298031-Rhodomonas_salina.1